MLVSSAEDGVEFNSVIPMSIGESRDTNHRVEDLQKCLRYPGNFEEFGIGSINRVCQMGLNRRCGVTSHGVYD